MPDSSFIRGESNFKNPIITPLKRWEYPKIPPPKNQVISNAFGLFLNTTDCKTGNEVSLKERIETD
ncbi:MAG: hypothetical protein J5786_04770, partial [Clostridiales bacterium]|nr:hypothetical protein [Clostridiales bacterium]